MKKWHSITRSDEYKALPPEGQIEAKRRFFERKITPVLNADPTLNNDEARNAAFAKFMAIPDDSGQGLASSMVGSAVRGFGEVVPGVMQGAGALMGLEPLEEAGKSVREGLESFAPVNPLYEGGIPAKVANVVGNVGSVVATGGLGGAAGKALAAERIAAAGAAKQAVINQAIQTGAKTSLYGTGAAQGAAEGKEAADRYGMEGGDAYLRTLMGSVANVLPEALPFGTALETALPRRLLGAVDDVAAPSIRRAGATESVEEMATQIMGNASTQALAPEGVETPDITEGVLEAGAYGGVGGVLFGGLAKLGRTPPDRQTPQQQAVAAEFNAEPVNEAPPVTPEQSAENSANGGIPVVTPDGTMHWMPNEEAANFDANLRQQEDEARKRDAKSREEQAQKLSTALSVEATQKLATAGSPLAATAQDEFNRIAAELESTIPPPAEADEQPVPPVEAEPEVEQASPEMSEGAARNRALIADAAAKLQGLTPPDISAGLQAAIPASPEITPRLQAAIDQKPDGKTSASRVTDIDANNDFINQGGWKLHLSVPPENYKAVDEWLHKNHKGQYKLLSGGSPEEGSDFTVYVGHKDAANSLSSKIESEIGGLLNPFESGPAKDAQFNTKVGGRFDVARTGKIEDVPWTFAGMSGVPFDEAAMEAIHLVGDAPKTREQFATKAAPHAERINKQLAAKYGDRYTGTETSSPTVETPTGSLPKQPMSGDSGSVATSWEDSPEFLLAEEAAASGDIETAERIEQEWNDRQSLARPPSVEGVSGAVSNSEAALAPSQQPVSPTAKFRQAAKSPSLPPQTTAAETQKETPLKLGYKQNEIRQQIQDFAKQSITDDAVTRFIRFAVSKWGSPSSLRKVRFAADAPLQVSPEPDGSIVVGLGGKQIAETVRQTGSPQAGFQYLADAIEEELIHLADYLAFRSKWDAAGRPGSFIDFSKAEGLLLSMDLLKTAQTLSAQDAEALRSVLASSLATYTNKEDATRASLEELLNIYSQLPQSANAELVRAIIQANRSGEITATGYQKILGVIKQWYEDALNWLKQAYKPAREGTFGPVLADRIASIERQLQAIDAEISQTTQAAETQTPDSVAVESGAAGVTVDQPTEGSISGVSEVSPESENLSTPVSDTVATAMSYLMDELSDGKRQWGPDKMAAAKAYFDSGGTNMDVLHAAFPKIAFARPITQAWFKADENAAKEQADKEKADADFKRNQERAVAERIKDDTKKAKRQADSIRILESLISGERKNTVQGTVTMRDARDAVRQIVASGDIPNVLFSWVGTVGDFLSDPTNKENFPGTWVGASKSDFEGGFENGTPFVFIDRVGVSDLDRKLARLRGTTPEIAAVRRVILHENIHKGVFWLSWAEKTELFGFLNRLYTSQELDLLASKAYKEYRDWRTNSSNKTLLLEEAMTRDFDNMVEIPRDGVWGEFMNFLRRIWQKITGKTTKPTLKDYRDVMRLIRNSLMDANRKQADTLKDNGGVRMSKIEPYNESTNNPFDAFIRQATDEPADLDTINGLARKYIEQRLLDVSGRIDREGIRLKSDAPLQAGAEPDGSIALGYSIPQERFDELQAMAPQAAIQYAKSAVEEEVIHLADMLGMRASWEQSGKRVPFDQFVIDEQNRLALDLIQTADSLPEQDAESLRKTLGGVIAAYENSPQIANLSLPELLEVAAQRSAYLPEVVRALIQAKRDGEITETGFRRIAQVLREWQDAVLRWLKGAYQNAQSGVFGSLLSSRIQDAEAILSTLRGDATGPVQYESADQAARSAGQETARHTIMSEEAIKLQFAIQQAYRDAPKQNSSAVPVSTLFERTKALIPDITPEQFSNALQSLYEDNAALFQVGGDEMGAVNVFNTDGDRASSVILMPRAMASRIPPEAVKKGSKAYAAKIIKAGKGRVDTAPYEGRDIKDFDATDHNKNASETYQEASKQCLDDLEKQGFSLIDIADSIQNPEFQEGLGLLGNAKISSATSSMAQMSLASTLADRLQKAAEEAAKNGMKAKATVLAKKSRVMKKYYAGMTTGAGQNLQFIQTIQSDPQTRDIFETEMGMEQRSRETTEALVGGKAVLGDIQDGAEKVSDQATQEVSAEAEDAVEDAAEDSLLREGEETLTEPDKGIYERIKDNLRLLAAILRRKNKPASNAMASRLSDELAVIAKLSDAELDAMYAKLQKENSELLRKLVGEDSASDTPAQKTTRKKRKKMVETAEKRAKKGKPVEPTDDAESSEDEVTKAEATAQAILKDLSERYSDPLIFKDKKPNINEMRELYKERVKQGNGASQMTEAAFVNKAIELGADEKTAGILWSAAELEIDAREAMRQDKIRQRNAKAGERADAQAHRIIFAKERLKRQSGFADIDTNPNKDSIIKAFREQVEKPIALDAFIQRLIPLKVSRQVAERLFRAAEREKTDLDAMAKYNLLQGPKALQKMIAEINLMRRGEEIPLKNPIPWRQLLSQRAATVEEYRQRIFDAVSTNPELQSLTDEQKNRLADLFSQAWEQKRKDILDRMLERHAMTLEAQNRKKAAKAIREAKNEILEAINLGVFDNDELAKILGEKFGLKTEFTDAEKKRIRDLSEQLQDPDINPAKRNRLSRDLLVELSSASKISVAEMLSNLWVSSVLSGFQTVFSIGAAFQNGAYEIIGLGVSRAIRKLMWEFDLKGAIQSTLDALEGFGRYLKAFPKSFARAWQYLWSGDVALLDANANDPLSRTKTLADLQRHRTVAEALARDPVALKRYLGLYLRFVGRLLTALDAFNVMVTKDGALPIALSQSGLDAKAIQEMMEKVSAKDIRQDIINKEFAGNEPKNGYERALVNSMVEAEMSRQMARFGLKVENQSYVASQSAMTLDPTGFGGWMYNKILEMGKQVEGSGDNLVKKLRLQMLDPNRKPETAAALAGAYVWQFFAYQAANILGVRFARFAGNKFNQGVSFLPVIGLLRLLESKDKRIGGAERAFRDSIVRNQMVGFLMTAVGIEVLKAIIDEPDDEKRGWAINGDWSNLTPDQIKQKLSRGEKQYTIRIGDKVLNYQNWPVNQTVSAVGSLSDMIRYSPKQFNEKNVIGKVLTGMVSGIKATTDIPALTQISEVFGKTFASRDPSEQALNRLERVSAGWAGGFMPRILKDLDYLSDPTMRKYETLWEKTASHIPIYRRYEGEEYFDILANPIQKNAIPGSREFMKLDPRHEYKVLGALNSRNIWLTASNPAYRTVGKGRNKRSLTQEEADKYWQETGKEYKNMLLRYGDRALAMPPERGRAFILQKSEEARDRALIRAVRK